jgi:hypothetical protein
MEVGVQRGQLGLKDVDLVIIHEIAVNRHIVLLALKHVQFEDIACKSFSLEDSDLLHLDMP